MVDLHTHTVSSDGKLTADELIVKAIENNIRFMAITDHNYIHEELPELRERYAGKIELINGAEFSTVYKSADGSKTEIHIIALRFENKPLIDLIARNKPDRQSYVNAIADALWDNCGIKIPSYDELRVIYSQNRHVGRMQIADYIAEHGYADSIDDALDKYIGNFGERRAYVNSLDYSDFASVEDAVRIICDAGGIPVLAHLFSYKLPEQECLRLLDIFKASAGDSPAGLEVFYGKYSESDRRLLMKIADERGLLYSSASDFHAKTADEKLMDKNHLQNCNLENHVISKLIG